MELQLTQEAQSEIKRVVAQYPPERKKSALLAVLHIVQKETGYLSADTMKGVAEILQLHPIEVYEVVTFYTMYHTKPVGKYVIDVCQTGPCMICGSDDVIAHLEKRLGIKVGETTEDKVFTLRAVECLGACGYAPMLQIGEKYYENLTEEKLDDILAELGGPLSDKYKKN